MEQAAAVAAGVLDRAPPAENLRELVALTIAVVTYAERAHRSIGKCHPDQ